MKRIAVSSDFHGQCMPKSYVETVKTCSALLICGDLFSIRQISGQCDLVKQIKGFTDNGIRVIYTPGNHDIWLYDKYTEDHQDDMDDDFFGGRICMRFLQGKPEPEWSVDGLRELCGIEVLIDSETDLDGLRVYGSPWCPHFCEWAFMGSDEFLKSKFEKIPEGLDILMTHTPPRVENLRLDVVRDSYLWEEPKIVHCGSSVLTEYIRLRKPRYSFSGHIHTGSHELVKIEDTQCANVSLLDEDYKVRFKPRIIEL